MTLNSSLRSLSDYINNHIIGQEHLTHRLMIALLADGHLLVEGAPGLAKTKAIKTLSECIQGDFHRLQFTPDLLPSDLTGTEIFRQETHSFEFQKGPIFHNLVLADEINRSPAKVQSALLEAMAEGQVTVGKESYPLPPLFLVMATQNPIEQEGTYPLPEAQLDRFMLHVRVDYPSQASERKILQLVRQEKLELQAQRAKAESRQKTQTNQACLLTQAELFELRQSIYHCHMSEAVEHYIVDLIASTREHAEITQFLDYGASPRATLALDSCARAHALLAGRDYVSPDDVQSMIHDILRHRLLLNFEAEASGLHSDKIIDKLLEIVVCA